MKTTLALLATLCLLAFAVPAASATDHVDIPESSKGTNCVGYEECYDDGESGFTMFCVLGYCGECESCGNVPPIDRAE